MTGFKSEVEGGVRESVANVGKIIGGALAAASAFEFGKKLIESAAEHQAAFAGLEKSTRNVGAATKVAGKGLEALLEDEARLKGFSDEQLAQSFLRLVTVTHDSAKAFADLGAAEDLSRARHIDLETSALAISKAVQGQTNSLQRYGIVVPHVRAAEDALAARRRAAVQDGATFTAAQNAIYVSALKVAKAQDQQAAKTEGLRIVQQRFGGSAKVFANTASGQFQRLQQDFHQFEAAVGTALLPGLAHGAEGVGKFIGALAHNEGFVREIHKDVHDLGQALHFVGDVASTIGPPILTVAKDLGGLVRVLEIGAAVAVGRKMVTYLESLLAVGAKTVGTDAAMSGATTAYSAALDANTAALLANTAAQTANNVSKDIQIFDQFGGVLTTVTTKEGEAAAGAAKIETAVGGAAGKLAVFAGAASRALGILTKLGAQYLIVNQLTKLLPGQHDLGLDFSNGTAGFVAGAHGSPYQKGSGADSLFQLGYERKKNPVTHEQLFSAKNFAFVEEEKQYQQGLAAAMKAGVPKPASLAGSFFDSLSKAWADGVDKFAKDVASGDGFRHAKKAADAAIKALRDGITTDEQSLADLRQQAALQAQTGADSILSAITSAKTNFSAIGQTIATDIAATLEQPFVVAQQQLTSETDRLALQFDVQSAKFQARATIFDQALQAIQFRQQARAAQFAGQNALLDQQSNRASLRSDQINLAQLRRSVILPGGKTLSSNNQDALAQLEAFARRSRGASRLAIQAFIVQYQQAIAGVERDKIGIATTPNPKTAQRQADLQVAQSRNQIQTAVVEAKHAAVAAQQQVRADIIRIGTDVAEARARVAAREIADLTDGFARAPSPAALKRVTTKIADLMARDHISFRTAGGVLGAAFMHGFQAQFTGLSQQGQALFGVKGAPSGGLIPGITKPLETIQQQALAQAQIARQQRVTQIDESRKQTTLLRKIHAAQAADKFTKSLAKNPGRATKNAKDLAGTTG